MKKSYLLVALVLVSMLACKPKTQKNIVENSIDSLVGNYVTADYANKDKGYDWVGVMISKLSDSTVNISVRSRCDLKKPTCTFDSKADLIGKDTLRASFEGKGILFIFADSTLTISAENAADEGLLNYFCSGGASLAGKYIRHKGELDQQQIDRTKFAKALTLGKYYFEVKSINDTLSITPIGLTKDNTVVKHAIAGSSVTNAEIGDLNSDGFPEVFVYLTSDGSGSYGNVIGYSVNNGKSMSMIDIQDINAEKPEITKGYMGHDEFAIVETSLGRRFPIYKEGDANSKPTGGIRQLQYKLKDGKNSRQLTVVDVVNY